MAFTTQTDVRAYFDSILSGLSLPNYTLDGNQFKPDGRNPFVRAKLFPQETMNTALGAQRKSMKGLLNVDIYIPRASGVAAGLLIAEQIVAAFPTTSYNALSGVNSSNNGTMTIWSSWIDQTHEEDPYLRTLVFVRYEAISIPT